MAADEIERFRREIVERTGALRRAENLSDQDLLREAMNTVGKEGRLGGETRCVVSVSMLTEGWDANTVTHVLGVRAFGTQLLCEQAVGRALRRQSYDLNEHGKFNVEYADVLGIPFDFTAKPVVARPVPPRDTVRVMAVTPERDSSAAAGAGPLQSPQTDVWSYPAYSPGSGSYPSPGREAVIFGRRPDSAGSAGSDCSRERGGVEGERQPVALLTRPRAIDNLTQALTA